VGFEVGSDQVTVDQGPSLETIACVAASLSDGTSRRAGSAAHLASIRQQIESIFLEL
jgi:hypothetical protein